MNANRISVNLSAGTYNWVKREAKRSKCSMSSLIADAIFKLRERAQFATKSAPQGRKRGRG